MVHEAAGPWGNGSVWNQYFGEIWRVLGSAPDLDVDECPVNVPEYKVDTSSKKAIFACRGHTGSIPQA